MRFFLTILISTLLTTAVANGVHLPFSESVKNFLDTEALSLSDIERLDAFAVRMDSRKNSFRKTKNFISYLNDQAHKEILLSYEQLKSFEELVSTGKYNCLTGSIFLLFYWSGIRSPTK